MEEPELETLKESIKKILEDEELSLEERDSWERMLDLALYQEDE
jgi:hypothetical protein